MKRPDRNKRSRRTFCLVCGHEAVTDSGVCRRCRKQLRKAGASSAKPPSVAT